MSVAAILRETPRSSHGMGLRTVGALFLALVAAILGAMPGWTPCFAAWLVLSWLVLGGVVAAAVAMGTAAALRGHWVAVRVEGRQICNVAVLMLLMLPMGLLSIGVEFASARAGLVARAEASARAGGPAIAMTPAPDEDWPVPASGFVYDRNGVLAQPPARLPADWRANPVVDAMTRPCIEMRHLVGPYYRWRGGCDER